jgi:hypothetical protein
MNILSILLGCLRPVNLLSELYETPSVVVLSLYSSMKTGCLESDFSRRCATTRDRFLSRVHVESRRNHTKGIRFVTMSCFLMSCFLYRCRHQGAQNSGKSLGKILVFSAIFLKNFYNFSVANNNVCNLDINNHYSVSTITKPILIFTIFIFTVTLPNVLSLKSHTSTSRRRLDQSE